VCLHDAINCITHAADIYYSLQKLSHVSTHSDNEDIRIHNRFCIGVKQPLNTALHQTFPVGDVIHRVKLEKILAASFRAVRIPSEQLLCFMGSLSCDTSKTTKLQELEVHS
jgi:hypothetical protein